MNDVRLASWRFLHPNLERSTASPNGRPVDLLSRCYRAVIEYEGFPALGEYYWTDRTDFLPNNLDPLVMWDDDNWRIPCGRKIQLTKGVNPCPPTEEPTPPPATWDTAALEASAGVILAACDKCSDIWWY